MQKAIYIVLLGMLLVSCREQYMFVSEDEIEPAYNLLSEISPADVIQATVLQGYLLNQEPEMSSMNSADLFFSGTDLPASSTAMVYDLAKRAYNLRNNSFRVAEGNTYRIIALLNNISGDSLISSTTIPYATGIDAFSIQDVQIEEVDNSHIKYTFTIELTLEEPRNQPAFYQILPFRRFTDYRISQSGDSIFTDRQELELLSIEEFTTGRNATHEFVHKDGFYVDYSRLSDSKVVVRLATVKPLNKFTEVLRSLSIKIHTLSPELYYYHENLDKQILSKQTNFSYPVANYSNVSNGLGVFGSYSVKQVSIPF